MYRFAARVESSGRPNWIMVSFEWGGEGRRGQGSNINLEDRIVHSRQSYSFFSSDCESLGTPSNTK